MKLVRHVRLSLQQGTSDRIYEVDLCELAGDRCVVNFRYGPRGGTLRDGSKTPLPVARDEADRLFDQLVDQKKREGFHDMDSGVPRPAPTGSRPVAQPEPAPPADPRHARIVAALEDPSKGWTHNVDVILFRASELRVPGITAQLVAMAAEAKGRRLYNVVRALLRCGDASAVPALLSLWEQRSLEGHIRNLAGHAVLELADADEADRFVRRQRAKIPEAVASAMASGAVGSALQELQQRPSALELLYLCASTEQDRARLVELLRSADARPPWWMGMRRILKAAEARSDGQVLGAVLHRVAQCKPTFPGFRGASAWVPNLGSVQRGDSRVGFSASTRAYMLRRGWRSLRRLGEVGLGDDYVRMATGLLLAVTDDDARQPRQFVTYDWYTRRERTSWSAPLGHLWAFNQILYRHSPDHVAVKQTLTFRLAGGVEPANAGRGGRYEAFPELWNGAPLSLIGLLTQSRCGEVHAFGVRALRDNAAAFGLVSTADLLAMVGAPYEGTADLAADIAVTRYDPAQPDLELVAALASCPHARGRDLALGWIRDNPHLFLADVEFVVELVLNPQAATRQLAMEVLSATAMRPDHAQIVVEAVIDRARRTGADDEAALAVLRDASAVLLTAFSQELRAIPLSLVTQLVRHRAEGVAELGAKILLSHHTRPPDLPDELLTAVLTSEFTVVRQIGVRLYGELDDDVLVHRFRVLVGLITSSHPDVRQSVRPVIGRLASNNPSFGRIIVEAVVPAICVAGPEGMHADVVAMLRSELAGPVQHLAAERVLAMLESPVGLVQEYGGQLLQQHVDPTTLSLSQIAGLASSDILTVRQASWSMMEDRLEELHTNADAMLDVLDASWPDSRQFGFHLVEERLGPDALSPDLTVAICDSVRPDVQSFGRRTVTRAFGSDSGWAYLLKLSQHPAPEMQLFASAWLDVHASGDAAQIRKIQPYLVGVMTRPNRGSIAKARVMAFLAHEAKNDRATAEVVAEVVRGLSASEAQTYRAQALEILVDIRRRHPDIDTPLTVVPPRTWTRPEATDAV